MAKFAMYLINLTTEEVFGSNSVEDIVAHIENHQEAGPSDFLILHSTYGNVQKYHGTTSPIEELVVEDDDEEDSDDEENSEEDGEEDDQ